MARALDSFAARGSAGMAVPPASARVEIAAQEVTAGKTRRAALRPGERGLRMVASDELHQVLKSAAEGDRPVELTEKIAHEARHLSIEQRLDRQQAVYKWNVKTKYRLVLAMRKFNRKISSYFRDLEKALTGLRQMLAEDADPKALGASFREVLGASSRLAGMLSPMTGMMRGMNFLNTEIRGASTLVTDEELKDNRGLDQISSNLAFRASLRDINALDDTPHLQVGKFAFDWSRVNIQMGSRTMGEGVALIRKALEERQDKVPRGAFSGERLLLRDVISQQARLDSTLNQLTQVDTFS